MNRAEFLIKDLPQPSAARRFLDELTEKHPSQVTKLSKKEGLLSDVLTIVSYSPLLATTILQNPSYIWWLDPKRANPGLRDKEGLVESLARFSMVNSQIETQVLLSRFRRRELLRIFLRDIRRLATIAEITEEISNLADAILEHTLGLATREMENRYGTPQEIDAKGRARPARFCIVSLGKLGSKELNYSSDIDLLFIYSAEGTTSGSGTRGAVTNREYFVKLAEMITKLVSQQTGEGAAYRVDMRLRPHGRIGALALSLADTARYYRTEARNWERQVLIRSRASAGDAEIYKTFFSMVEDHVFSKDETVENALRSVRLSKEKIDLQQTSDKGFNVKLGRGGIREIEFIAQALQLAFGGRDEWLRSPHTLISLSRLADRGLIKKPEITGLSRAYDFLRHLEHILQMEHGLQTHTVPTEHEKRALVARRMGFDDPAEFEKELVSETGSVSSVFTRIFGEGSADILPDPGERPATGEKEVDFLAGHRGKEVSVEMLADLGKVSTRLEISDDTRLALKKLVEISPHFSQVLAANPGLIDTLATADWEEFDVETYTFPVMKRVHGLDRFAYQLHVLRRDWSRYLMEIVMHDILGHISRKESKKRQTDLAEAAIEAALFITRSELEKRFSIEIDDFPFAVLGLGKLGGKGMDYGSDLDLILVYDDERPPAYPETSHAEFYGRAVEIFVNVLSSMTPQGSLYRVDLRLRPYGKNGTSSISKRAFLDYLATKAAMWEWLAYVKIRGVAGDMKLACETENEVRRIIHRNANESRKADSELADLRNETRRVRLQLEKKAGTLKGREIDIKFGEGGMLDIYFLMRFLQLRDDVPDDAENRSSDFMLNKLLEKGSISDHDYHRLMDAYEFLSNLDHNLRLTIGRSTRVPLANRSALEIISQRLGVVSTTDLLEKLTFHRINIRTAFDNIVGE